MRKFLWFKKYAYFMLIKEVLCRLQPNFVAKAACITTNFFTLKTKNSICVPIFETSYTLQP